MNPLQNPEPPPAPPEPEPELNELDNAMAANEVTVDPLAPAAEGAIPAAFQDRWGQRADDCRPGDTIGGGLVVGGDSLQIDSGLPAASVNVLMALLLLMVFGFGRKKAVTR